MAYYYRADSNEVRELDPAVIQAWVDADNPKAALYTLIPDPPSPQHRWDGSQWVAPPVYVPPPVTADPEDIEAVVAQFNTLLARMRELGFVT